VSLVFTLYFCRRELGKEANMATNHQQPQPQHTQGGRSNDQRGMGSGNRNSGGRTRGGATANVNWIQPVVQQQVSAVSQQQEPLFHVPVGTNVQIGPLQAPTDFGNLRVFCRFCSFMLNSCVQKCFAPNSRVL
jgi:hypothetical protein